jgi:hypothetical protein
MSKSLCEACARYRGEVGAMTQGRWQCRVCKGIFGAMTGKELAEMDALIENASDKSADLWVPFGQIPRPSVIRRLVDEVRARRLMAHDVYVVNEKNSMRGVTAESVLEAIREEKNE